MSSEAGSSARGRLGKYSILEELGHGGMARVYLAQRAGSPEVCVLKQLLLELLGRDIAVKRFRREALLASQLLHPNIAQVLDAGFEDEAFCVAFELILGKDLEAMAHALVKKGRLLPYEISIAAILGALEGLSYAHSARDAGGAPMDIVHRDLSPRNIMVDTQGRAKIIDFGVARGRGDDLRTAPGTILGTLRYLSPEQAAAEPVDRRSDLYSLSVVLHELLTGAYLVPSGAPRKILSFVVLEALPPVSSINPGLPRALDAVIARGLAKDAKDRWQSAAEYRDALREAAGPLATWPPEALGEFIRAEFAADIRRVEELAERARAQFLSAERAAAGSAAEPTRTRTGFSPIEPWERTLRGDEPVVPVDLVRPSGEEDTSASGAEPTEVPTELGTAAGVGPTEIRPRIASQVGAGSLEVVVGRRSPGRALALVLGLSALAALSAWRLLDHRGSSAPTSLHRESLLPSEAKGSGPVAPVALMPAPRAAPPATAEAPKPPPPAPSPKSRAEPRPLQEAGRRARRDPLAGIAGELRQLLARWGEDPKSVALEVRALADRLRDTAREADLGELRDAFEGAVQQAERGADPSFLEKALRILRAASRDRAESVRSLEPSQDLLEP